MTQFAGQQLVFLYFYYTGLNLKYCLCIRPRLTHPCRNRIAHDSNSTHCCMTDSALRQNDQNTTLQIISKIQLWLCEKRNTSESQNRTFGKFYSLIDFCHHCLLVNGELRAQFRSPKIRISIPVIRIKNENKKGQICTFLMF